jgi:hypothetical protein
MNGVAPSIEIQVRAEFSEDDAELMLLALSEMKSPPLDAEFYDLRKRVHEAILLLAGGNPNALLRRVASSQIDWRDTLVGAEALKLHLQKERR